MIPPISLDDVWAQHKANVLAPRDDGRSLHASDLHACAFALHQRLSGVPQLPYDDGSFANFERGHAVEARLYDALVAYAPDEYPEISRGEQVEHEGIIGNIDFVLYRVGVEDTTRPYAIIDVSTTASKSPDWKYGHALKSAFYAVAKGCDVFCEWVFCFGFGGTVTAQKAHWFRLDDPFLSGSPVTWREAVTAAIVRAKGTPHLQQPPEIPPVDPVTMEQETWRCGKSGSGKSYCNARCPRNAAYDPASDEMELA